MTRAKPPWLLYLPEFMRCKIEHRPNLLAILSNTGWLFADKIFRIGVGLFVELWLARYLGPEQFGLWSYVIAFTALFSAFATLGLDGVVIRELVKSPERQNVLLGTAFKLKLIGGASALLFALLTIFMLRRGDILTIWLVGISAAGFIFQSVNVINFYFQAKVKSRFIVYASNAAFLFITILKIVLLLIAAPLIAFAWTGLAEVILTAIFLIICYRVNHNHVQDWFFDWHLSLKLLRDSWPLIISSLAAMIYARIDQVMIPFILNNFELGLFSASVRLTEAWLFIPMIVASSVFPNLIDLKKHDQLTYEKRLLSVYSSLALVAILVASFVTIFASEILNLLFGKDYLGGADVLKIRIWETVFAAIGVITGNWVLIEGKQKQTLIFSVFGMLINISLNLILIPLIGIKGAAISSLVSIIFVIIILPLCEQDMRNDVHRRILALSLWPLILYALKKYRSR